ncbi:MAG: hypothetical protein ACK4QW_11580 [Alphaproteobacteria bacterium]
MIVVLAAGVGMIGLATPISAAGAPQAPAPTVSATASQDREEQAIEELRAAERARSDAVQDRFYTDQSDRSKDRTEALDAEADRYYKRP